MCAICGILNYQNKDKIDQSIINRMLKAVKHRGPDGRDSFLSEDIALGFNRLSFLDLAGGMQPIWNEDESIVMVCNGEIFNYARLRDDMLVKGHHFRTGTDVEVILHLYEEYGTEFPNYLNGQFAIALYDSRYRQLLLVRDQIGISPLFYALIGGKVIFASEIKAILEYPGIEKKLNLKAVDQLMNFPGIVSPVTFFEGIYSLQCGHMLQIHMDGEMRDIEYWDLIYSAEEEEDRGEEYYVERLRALLKESISRRLVADVPIGFYISGGLDSSVVACYIGKFLLNSYYSFSAEIGSGELDESRFQKIIRDYVHSVHYSTRVTEEEIWENIGHVIYHAETAVKESYDVAAYLLSGLVSGSPAKAVLTGQGSDEFFCGYAGYMVDQFRSMRKGSMTTEECEISERLWGDSCFRYERNHHQIREIHSQIYSADIRGEMNRFSALSESPVKTERLRGLSSQKRRSYIDYKLRLADHLLGEHGDRMFFSHSIEGRHPFLDMDLLKFVIRIPDKYKLNGLDEKYILKRAGEGIVPEEILKRKKFPFQAPGMSSVVAQPGVMEYISEERIRKYHIFDSDCIGNMKKKYVQKDFKLMGAYEIDYLMIVMTVTMLCEKFGLSV